MKITEKNAFEDKAGFIAEKGEKLGNMLHNVLKHKLVRLVAYALAILFGVFGFMYLFSKRLFKGPHA